MADIINMNKVRKAKAKLAAVDKAAANRAKFGRTRAQKAQDAAERARSGRAVDGAELE